MFSPQQLHLVSENTAELLDGTPVQSVELEKYPSAWLQGALFSEGLPSCVARRPLFHKVNLPRCEARRRLSITGLNSMIYIIYILYYLVFTLYFLVFALCLIKLHCSQPILRFKNFFHVYYYNHRLHSNNSLSSETDLISV